MLRCQQMFHQGRHAIGKTLCRVRPAVDALDRVGSELREGIPLHIPPHALEEHVGLPALTRFGNPVSRSHTFDLLEFINEAPKTGFKEVSA